jgi:hypothetical protein
MVWIQISLIFKSRKLHRSDIYWIFSIYNSDGLARIGPTTRSIGPGPHSMGSVSPLSSSLPNTISSVFLFPISRPTESPHARSFVRIDSRALSRPDRGSWWGNLSSPTSFANLGLLFYFYSSIPPSPSSNIPSPAQTSILACINLGCLILLCTVWLTNHFHSFCWQVYICAFVYWCIPRPPDPDVRTDLLL